MSIRRRYSHRLNRRFIVPNFVCFLKFSGYQLLVCPAAISWAAIVMTLLLVLLLLNRSVAATIPVKKAVAICSSKIAWSPFKASLTDTSISLILLLLLIHASRYHPVHFDVSPHVNVATVASWNILPCARSALSRVVFIFYAQRQHLVQRCSHPAKSLNRLV